MGEGRQIILKRAFDRWWAGLVLVFCLLLSPVADAGVPVISHERVTDVATRSFAVILTVSEPSTPLLSLFAADCTTPAAGFTTALQQNPASGNLRLTVSGLSAATGYCYQLAVTSTATTEVTTTAAAPVTTATAIVRTTAAGSDSIPIGNDILKAPAVHLAPGESRAAIIIAMELTNSSAMTPLSMLLSTSSTKDYFNANNLFKTVSGKTIRLSGGERVKLTEIHGASGCVIDRFRTIPGPSDGTVPRDFAMQANASDIDASGGVNILDVLRIVGGKGTDSSGTCFNSDLDLNADGVIDVADLTIIKGGFNGLP
jgi:hypothetical protein